MRRCAGPERGIPRRPRGAFRGGGSGTLSVAVSTKYQALRAADPTAMDGEFPLPVVSMIEATHYAEGKRKGIIP